jgi:hypothetical protein
MRLFCWGSRLAALALILGTVPAGAQWLERKTPGIPRTANGKPNLTAPAPRGPDGKPDLSGIWNGEEAPAPQPDPAGMQQWVKDLVRERQNDFFRTRPFYQCLPSGPEAELFAVWRRIVQTPTAIAILLDNQAYRLIHTDGRELENDPAPSWMGYSVGRWDGDTLVVDSVGFNDKTWVSRRGLSHTDALRMRERYRRPDFGHLEVEVTFTDPGAYAKPWGFTARLELVADTEMLESICERSSDHWSGKRTDATDAAVHVAPEVLAGYVGVYKGIYQGEPRTVEISISGGELFVVSGGGERQRLVPRSQTLFETGLGYQFIVDDKGVATDVVEIHVSGPYKYPRQGKAR